jgi:hypothetical protein
VLDDLAGGIGWDALLQRDYLPDAAAGGGLDLGALEIFHRDVPLDEPRLQDIPHGFELEVVLGGQRQRARFLIELDRRARAFEVEPLADLLARLVDGVVDLGQLDGRGDVE